LIDQYLDEAQSRTKEPLRKATADTRRYILQKFASDTGINRAGEITGAKISQWLIQLKRDGKSKDTLWTYGERVRNFVKYLMPKRETSIRMPPALSRDLWTCSYIEAHIWDPDIKLKVKGLDEP
jgi:site-specific recombinase XerC